MRPNTVIVTTQKSAKSQTRTRPCLAVIFAVLGIAKTALDALFMVDLNTTRLDSEKDITTRLRPGVYVVFASENSKDYEKFKKEPNELRWSNSYLSFKGESIERVSYYVVEVDTRLARFPTANAALGSGATWASAYNQIEATIRRLGFGGTGKDEAAFRISAKSTADQVVTMLTLAGETLAKDQSLTGYDRLLLQAQLETRCEILLRARITELAKDYSVPVAAAEAFKLETPLLNKARSNPDFQMALDIRSGSVRS